MHPMLTIKLRRTGRIPVPSAARPAAAKKKFAHSPLSGPQITPALFFSFLVLCIGLPRANVESLHRCFDSCPRSAVSILLVFSLVQLLREEVIQPDLLNRVQLAFEIVDV